ncbi:hypothetical protein [Micromonospora aurantiaca (nom. illeg.)]|uniref:hypothetical protein n=1 Tax=Micromonospora aurantiaca (nom. illeg.) TaxID=47850 RepID=UPI003405D57B
MALEQALGLGGLALAAQPQEVRVELEGVPVAVDRDGPGLVADQARHDSPYRRLNV